MSEDRKQIKLRDTLHWKPIRFEAAGDNAADYTPFWSDDTNEPPLSADVKHFTFSRKILASLNVSSLNLISGR
jgi:hypothetical protein